MSPKPRASAVTVAATYLKSHPGMSAEQVRRNLCRKGANTAAIRAAAEKLGYEFADTAAPTVPKSRAPALDLPGGIKISCQRVMSHKPATSTRVHIHRLPKGRAFEIKD